MAKTPLTNLVTFPGPSASHSSPEVPIEELYLGRFTAAECASICDRFHNKKEPIKRLANEHVVGNSIIEELVRVPRKPPANSQQNDRRERKAS